MNKKEYYKNLLKNYNFDKKEKELIDLFFKYNLDLSYIKPDFNYGQLHEIYLGLRKGLDVSIYATDEFTWEQMKQIRLGLQNKINVESYLNPSIDWKEMERIREELERNK